MVQKGKFSAGIASFVTMLKKVDLPTFGNPTIPILRWEEKRPRMGRSAGAASFFALGGIVGGGRRRCDREWLGFLVGSGGAAAVAVAAQ